MRLSSLFVSMTLLVALGCADPGPPVAGGKPVDHWLEALEDKDPKVRIKAIEKLGNIGAKSTDATGAIVGALNDEDAGVRKVAIFAVVRNPSTWGTASERLEEMGRTDESEEIRKLATEAHGNLTK